MLLEHSLGRPDLATTEEFTGMVHQNLSWLRWAQSPDEQDEQDEKTASYGWGV